VKPGARRFLFGPCASGCLNKWQDGPGYICQSHRCIASHPRPTHQATRREVGLEEIGSGGAETEAPRNRPTDQPAYRACGGELTSSALSMSCCRPRGRFLTSLRIVALSVCCCSTVFGSTYVQ